MPSLEGDWRLLKALLLDKLSQFAARKGASHTDTTRKMLRQLWNLLCVSVPIMLRTGAQFNDHHNTMDLSKDHTAQMVPRRPVTRKAEVPRSQTCECFCFFDPAAAHARSTGTDKEQQCVLCCVRESRGFADQGVRLCHDTQLFGTCWSEGVPFWHRVMTLHTEALSRGRWSSLWIGWERPGRSTSSRASSFALFIGHLTRAFVKGRLVTTHLLRSQPLLAIFSACPTVVDCVDFWWNLMIVLLFH